MSWASKILYKRIAEKDFKEVNVKLAVFTIFSALNADLIEIYKGTEKLSQEEIVDSISNLLLKGLKR
jgi:flagellar basal body-associated protein FliL